ncbi:hypothetical protein VTL71DRAFT_1281 [Oculimacula yallundae]|uniref:Sodium/calcium exchanger membrane region domain-containing protein n=1 Tax=Oculimacula yallundae TaxID=86028 RepID=A0ABR4CBF3_9HELO
MDRDSLIFNSCAFIASLFLLQSGAALFTTNTAIIGRRCGIPETLIALLTVGAEWEELAIVVTCIIQKRPSLALGNVVGSSISNVMGAFALGILFNKNSLRFDASAKIYSGALFVVSTIFAILAFTELLDLTGGIFFIVAFAVYVVSICSAIYDGILDPTPEEGEVLEDVEDSRLPVPDTDHQELHISIYPSVLQCHPTETSPLLPTNSQPPAPTGEPPRQTGITWHAFLVLISLTAMFIAAYGLSQSADSLSSLFQISHTLIGITLVSFSTTLPEKIIAIIGSWQSHTTTMTATTAGSNMFLLTLCIGMILVSGVHGDADDDSGRQPLPASGLLTNNLVAFEVWTVWSCSVLLMLITWTGSRRWLGALLFGLYISFIAVELTHFRR